MPNTPLRHFRLDDRIVEKLDFLQKKMGLSSRTEVIRLLVLKETHPLLAKPDVLKQALTFLQKAGDL